MSRAKKTPLLPPPSPESQRPVRIPTPPPGRRERVTAAPAAPPASRRDRDTLPPTAGFYLLLDQERRNPNRKDREP